MATAATLPTTPPTMAGMLNPTSSAAPLCACPSCGTTLDLPELQSEAQKYAALLQQAQRQIAQLQVQVQTLSQQKQAGPAATADSAQALTTTRPSSSPSTTTAPANISSSASPRSSFLGTGRISQLFGSRGSSNNNTLQPPDSPSTALPRPHSSSSSSSSSSPPPPPLPAKNSRPTTPATSAFPQRSAAASPSNNIDSPSAKSLLKELLMEKKLRAAAEAKIDNTSKEVEELSVSLFEQANEMVASERRARAKLEERVSVLEQRDVEKRLRLDRLEGAMTRLDRVRALLGDNAAGEETVSDSVSMKSGTAPVTVTAPIADTQAVGRRGDGDESKDEHDGA